MEVHLNFIIPRRQCMQGLFTSLIKGAFHDLVSGLNSIF